MPSVNVDVLDPYIPLLDAKETYIDLLGGRGSGKSYFAMHQYVPLRCLETPGMSIAVLRKYATTLETSVWKALRSGIVELGIEDSTLTRKTLKQLHFNNGSAVYCMGADDTEKIKSLEMFDVAVIEEATEFSELDLINIDAAIKSDRKTIMYLHNPVFVPPGRKTYLQKKFEAKKNHRQVITTYRDNIANVTGTYIDTLEELKKTNPPLWEMWANGRYATAEGAIFRGYDVVEEVPPGTKCLGVGIDFGYTVGPSALVQVWARENEIWVKEIVYATMLSNHDIISLLQKHDLRGCYIVADSEDPKAIDEIKHAGFVVSGAAKGAGSVLSGVMQMMQLKIHILRGSDNILNEFAAYSWKKDRSGKDIGIPEDDNNHAIDAIRYRVCHAGSRVEII